jgi:hypothetical protein
MRIAITKSMVLKNLTVVLSTAPGAGNTRTFTLYKNAVATAMVVTLTGAAATTGQDTTNTVSVTTYDTVSVYSDVASGPAASYITISIDYVYT